MSEVKTEAPLEAEKEAAIKTLSELGTVIDMSRKWRELIIAVKNPEGIRVAGKRILFDNWNQLKKCDAPHFNNKVLSELRKGKSYELPMDNGNTYSFSVKNYDGLLDAHGVPAMK